VNTPLQSRAVLPRLERRSPVSFAGSDQMGEQVLAADDPIDASDPALAGTSNRPTVALRMAPAATGRWATGQRGDGAKLVFTD